MRKFSLIVALVLCICMMSGCCLSHKWVEATCEMPKLCEKCGETEGKAIGHLWSEATREAPKTCQVCGQTEGEPLSVYDLFPEGTPLYDDTQFFLTDQDFMELYADALAEHGFSLVTEDMGAGVPPLLFVANPQGEMTGIMVTMQEDPETGKLAFVQMKLDLLDPDDEEKFDEYGDMTMLALDVLLREDRDSYDDAFADNMEIVDFDMETGDITIATQVSDMDITMAVKGKSLRVTCAPVNG